MKLIILKSKLIITLFLSFCFIGFAKDANARDSSGKKFDPKEMILHHVKDAYGMHIATLNANEDHPIHISIPLPVIVYTKKGITVFSSSAFHHDYHGHEIVEKNGQRFINLHEKVYVLDPGANEVMLDADGYAINAHRPKFDLSITRNVFMMWVSIALLLFIFLSAARRYKKAENYVPSGIASFLEPLIVFVRDEIGKPMIGAKKYKPYMPYLLTIFFFIWKLLMLLFRRLNVFDLEALSFKGVETRLFCIDLFFLFLSFHLERDRFSLSGIDFLFCFPFC